MIKKVLSILLLTVMIIIPCTGFTYAGVNTSVEIIPCEDGSYYLITTTVENTSTRAANTKSADKTLDYIVDGKTAWSFTVFGSFTYDGSTATATKSDCSYKIYDSSWSNSRKSSSCSEATVTGKGTFTKNGLPKSITLTLTCSPSGDIS